MSADGLTVGIKGLLDTGQIELALRLKPKTTRRKGRTKAPLRPNGGSDLQSILKETPKLILARRISKALVDTRKGVPQLSVEQSKAVLRYVLDYLEDHPEADLDEGLPEVVSESFL